MVRVALRCAPLCELSRPAGERLIKLPAHTHCLLSARSWRPGWREPVSAAAAKESRRKQADYDWDELAL